MEKNTLQQGWSVCNSKEGLRSGLSFSYFLAPGAGPHFFSNKEKEGSDTNEYGPQIIRGRKGKLQKPGRLVEIRGKSVQGHEEDSKGYQYETGYRRKDHSRRLAHYASAAIAKLNLAHFQSILESVEILIRGCAPIIRRIQCFLISDRKGATIRMVVFRVL